MAKRLLDFAESGPELVVQLYYCAFQHQSFNLEGPAPLLRSYILSMSMDARDAFRLAISTRLSSVRKSLISSRSALLDTACSSA